MTVRGPGNPGAIGKGHLKDTQAGFAEGAEDLEDLSMEVEEHAPTSVQLLFGLIDSLVLLQAAFSQKGLLQGNRSPSPHVWVWWPPSSNLLG